MANMTLLATWYAGAPDIEDAGGAVTNTASGLTYAAAEHFTGEQGVIIDTGDAHKTSTAVTTAQVPIASGAMAVWFRPDTATGGSSQHIVQVNKVASSVGDSFYLYISGSTGFFSGLFGSAGSSQAVSSGVSPSLGDAHFGYLEWNGTDVLVEIDGTEVAGTRGATDGWYSGPDAYIHFGYAHSGGNHLKGMEEAVAIFDAPLTSAERTFLRTSTTPWTFGMALSAPSNTAPTVDAGANATITAGDTLTRTVSFTDPDADTWTATVDYGEGAGAVAATVDQGNKTVALSNEYETAGEYTVTVVVNDGTTTGQDTFTLTVNNAPTSGYYTVIDVAGTDVGAPIITLD